MTNRFNRIVFAPSDTAAPAAPSAAAAAPAAPAAPATGAPAAPAAPAAGGGVSPPPVAFAETLPEKIRGEAAFRDIKSLDALATSYLNAQKLLGHPVDRLTVLPAANDAEGLAALHAKLGRPEKPEGYTFTPPKGAPAIDPALQTAFAGAAHAAGLSDSQAQALFGWYNTELGGRVAAAAEGAKVAQEKATAALKAEWGTAYDQNLGLARAALNHYGDADLRAYLEETRTGDDPRMLKAFAKLGRQLSEDGVIGRSPTTGMGKSPAEARQEIASLQTDPAFMKQYQGKNAPGHTEAMARMTALYEQAYPSAPTP